MYCSNLTCYLLPDKPTDPPRDVKVQARDNSIRVAWSPPLYRPEVIIQYTIFYRISQYPTRHTVTATSNISEVNIPISDHEGQMFTIQVAASTDGGISNVSRTAYVRSCE